MSETQSVMLVSEDETSIRVSVGDNTPEKYTATGWYTLEKETMQITDDILGGAV